jgi:NAD(P)-dependent dehydrogenase (short-subunit alcohol dehydrogenase family)
MRIAVIDGQGGGIGRLIVEKLRQSLGAHAQILALGTNSLATAAMLKAGATEGATGESAIVYNSSKVELILGPIGIISAYSLMGELSPAMAHAIATSPAQKLLVPMNKCNIVIAGVETKTVPQLVDELVAQVKAHEI